MKIRFKLALQFLLIGAAILLTSFLVIYFLSSYFRGKIAEKRLENRGITYARLLFELQLVDANTLNIIDYNTSKIHLREQVYIYDDQLRLIYTNFNPDSSLMNSELLAKTRLYKKYSFKRNFFDGVSVLYETDKTHYYIIATGFDEYGVKWMIYLENVLLISFFAGLGILFISGYYYAGRSLRPMKRVVEQVENINISKLNTRLKVHNYNDEIGQLITTFNNLLQRIEDAFALQRQFVSNASHELRTPLTRLTSEIEVALMKERTVQEYVATLESLYEELKIMNSLAHGLLELAHSDLDVSRLKMSDIRIDEIIFHARTELLKAHEDYRIKIDFARFPEEDSKLTVHGNENLLRIAFINVFDNACKFSDDHFADVVIEFFSENVIIKVKDNGIGIPEHEMDKIWEPFYRAENTRNYSGHGIGLSLIKKIILMHNGEIKINSTVNLGTEVLISLPVKK